uniref:Uncharacterized protein n=1 Tax=Arundo donax TaxID=35708 RepID=A0A0A9A4N1_ARUDO
MQLLSFANNSYIYLFTNKSSSDYPFFF